jgi:hypothetical protein
VLTSNQDYDAGTSCKALNKMSVIFALISKHNKLIRDRSTKGIGRTQPVDWKDAGEALSNDDLVGCHMPAGPGKDVSPPGAYLEYNEVSLVLFFWLNRDLLTT